MMHSRSHNNVTTWRTDVALDGVLFLLGFQLTLTHTLPTVKTEKETQERKAFCQTEEKKVKDTQPENPPHVKT
jgi:hypothetical protein